MSHTDPRTYDWLPESEAIRIRIRKAAGYGGDKSMSFELSTASPRPTPRKYEGNVNPTGHDEVGFSK